MSPLLTILRAYIVAARPKTPCKSLASYGDWSELCRQPLLWLGCADPTEALFQGIAEDPDRETLARQLTYWRAVFGSAPAKVRDAIPEARGPDDKRAELLDLMQDIAGERGEINRLRLGPVDRASRRANRRWAAFRSGKRQ
jgi:hypothetical protein